jgi:hypothetical protein
MAFKSALTNNALALELRAAAATSIERKDRNK